MIHIRGLKKTLHETKVLDGVDLDLPEGLNAHLPGLGGILVKGVHDIIGIRGCLIQEIADEPDHPMAQLQVLLHASQPQVQVAVPQAKGFIDLFGLQMKVRALTEEIPSTSPDLVVQRD
jgi:hypothetical protein